MLIFTKIKHSSYNNSKEQVCVLVVRDRQNKPSLTWWGSYFNQAIGSKVSVTNPLFTDAWRAFKAYAKEKGIEHYPFKSWG